ncbi:hypothetical protein ACHAXR_012396 [Thalassiosira sp. AJA248-18]
MVDLFGGAIATSVPSTWRDVSQVRQVPDNQEVFQDCIEASGAVLVVEILECQKNVENSDACAFFLKDLADANEAFLEDQCIHSGQVVDLDQDDKKKEKLFPNFSLPASLHTSQLHACIARGSQKVAQGKGSTSNAHWIDVEICALRLKSVETDLLLTLSIPRKANKIEGMEAEHSDVFKGILSSFNINDWSLFG